MNRRKPFSRRARATLVATFLGAVIGTGGFGPALSDELWGAYTGYQFDDLQGDDGYGLAWNFPDPDKAMAQALESCRQQQPPVPQGEEYDETWRYHSGERCGDVLFAFSTDGPSPATVTRTPDPAWAEGFEKLTVIGRGRCIGVVEVTILWFDQELGKNFDVFWGVPNYWEDSEEGISAQIEQNYSREHAMPHRVDIIICNDQ